MNKDGIDSFLRLGYSLDYNNENVVFDFSEVDKSNFLSFSEVELIQYGKKILLEIFNEMYESKFENVIPISGGLDSRCILAGLLEFTDASKLNTFTYGTPNTHDYDIGNYIAKKTGTKHTNFSLAEYTYSIEEMIDIASRMGNEVVLFHHGPIHQIDKLYSNSNYWSGFLGETISGSHLNYPLIEDINIAKQNFIDKNSIIKSTRLSNITDVELFRLIDYPKYNIKNITLAEQLDLFNRQTKYIYPHVLLKGYNYKTPFQHNKWMNFMLSINNEYRFNQYLYKKILLRTFPKLFSYKTKSNYGLPLTTNRIIVNTKRLLTKIGRGLTKHNKNVNYLDFNARIRDKNDLNHIIYESLMDLEQRQIIDWVDIKKLWHDHMNGNDQYADALLVLSSLEIHFKSEEARK